MEVVNNGNYDAHSVLDIFSIVTENAKYEASLKRVCCRNDAQYNNEYTHILYIVPLRAFLRVSFL